MSGSGKRDRQVLGSATGRSRPEADHRNSL